MELLGGFRRIVVSGVVFLLIVACWAQPAHAQRMTAEEYEVKTAFIFNFTKFVEWPPEAFPRETEMAFCILGEDPFGSAIDTLRDERVNDRRLIIKYPRDLNSLKSCAMLFISGSERDRLRQITEAVRGLNILTIGETEGYAAQGVIINLYKERSKVRFEINVDAAKRAGLKISAKLLSLARIVQDNR